MYPHKRLEHTVQDGKRLLCPFGSQKQFGRKLFFYTKTNALLLRKDCAAAVPACVPQTTDVVPGHGQEP